MSLKQLECRRTGAVPAKYQKTFPQVQSVMTPKLPVFVANIQMGVASKLMEGYRINSLRKSKMAAQPGNRLY
jgi:hypothetical protein